MLSLFANTAKKYSKKNVRFETNKQHYIVFCKTTNADLKQTSSCCVQHAVLHFSNLASDSECTSYTCKQILRNPIHIQLHLKCRWRSQILGGSQKKISFNSSVEVKPTKYMCCRSMRRKLFWKIGEVTCGGQILVSRIPSITLEAETKHEQTS